LLPPIKNRDSRKNRLAHVLAIVSAIGLAVYFLNLGGFTDFLTRALTAQRFEVLTRVPTDQLVVVDIDARSLQSVGVWPWPRGLHASLVDRLTEAGADQIVFDIDFSATSSEADDAAFAAAIERAGGIVSLAMFRQKSERMGSPSDSWIVNQPIDRFMDVSWPVIVSVPIEPDGMVWRNLLADEIDGTTELSLPALLADTEGTAGQTFWIDYGIRPGQLKVVSYADVLDGAVDPDLFQGKKVVVGASAQELRDLFPVPVHGILPGSMIQVLAAESLLQDRALSVIGKLPLLILVLALVFPMMLFWDTRWKLRLFALGGASLALEAAAFIVQLRSPVILDTGAAQIAIFLTAAILALKQIGFHQLLLKVARAQTQNARRMLDQVFDDSFDAIIVLTEDGKVCAVSKMASEIFSPDMIPGVQAIEYLPPEIVKDALRVFGEDGENPVSTELKTVTVESGPNSGRILEYTVTRPVIADLSGAETDRDEKTALSCITCRDVTEQRRAAERIEYLAIHEPLTGLLNRNGFVDELEKRLGASYIQTTPFVLAVFSVAGMDKITASLGFSHADKLRKAIAEELEEFLKQGDLRAIIAEDRFACMVRAANSAAAPGKFVERLQDALSREYVIGGHRIPVTVNIGYSITFGSSHEPDKLLREAANALSHAQAGTGHSIVAFDDGLEAGLNRRQFLEIELGKALQRNEIKVVFQPQVDLETGTLIGVESLSRWHHPELGAVSPVEFIQVAEESRLIIELGAWVLEESLRQAMTWTCTPKVAVNVSAVQLTESDMPETVRQALEKTGFPAERLDLEVTESLFIDEGFDLLTQLQKLRELGCHLSLDDFGTGYSGLGYIPRFPFTKIKIDRSFVMNMTKDQAHRSIVKAVVDMASAFKMSVLAEGIETIEHERQLLDLGCHIGQGYLYSKPVDGSEIDDFAANRDFRKVS
jgi:diguanylate cyclase (GGDEF)-like protein